MLRHPKYVNMKISKGMIVKKRRWKHFAVGNDADMLLVKLLLENRNQSENDDHLLSVSVLFSCRIVPGASSFFGIRLHDYGLHISFCRDVISMHNSYDDHR